MIDYFALALGHGLLVVALLRLVLRDGLDVDPLLTRIAGEVTANRKAARLIRAGHDVPAAPEDAGPVTVAPEDAAPPPRPAPRARHNRHKQRARHA
jgi:hypothetical protein